MQLCRFKHLSLYLIISCLSLTFAESTLNNIGKLKSNLQKAPKIGGYVQIQGYGESKSNGNIKTTTNENGLRIRRARLKAEGLVNDNVGYEVQINMNNNAVELEDGYIFWNFLNNLQWKLGRFTMPFGYEIYRGSKKTYFAERSRYWSYLFKENRNIGSELSYKVNDLILQVAYFHSYVNSSTSERERDGSIRIIWKPSTAYIGASAYYDHKDLRNSISEIERKAAFFTGVKYNKLSIDLEGIIQWDQFNALMASGASLIISYKANDDWRFSYRTSTLLFENPTLYKGQEIGFGNRVPSQSESKIYDMSFSTQYFITENSYAGLTYNPSIYHGQHITHAGYLQIQLVF